MKWTDLYLLAFRKHLYPRLLGDWIEIYNNVRSGEEIFRGELDAMTGGDIAIRQRLAHVPNVEGTRGFDKGKYNSTSHTLRRYLRVAANRVVPSLWI